MLTPAVQCGCAALHIQHREAGRAVLAFFENLIEALGRSPRGFSSRERISEASHSALGAIFTLSGGAIVQQLVLGVAGALPVSRVRHIAPLLMALVRADGGSANAWISAAIGGLPAEAHADGQAMLGAICSAEALRDDKTFAAAVEAFSLACRRKRLL